MDAAVSSPEEPALWKPAIPQRPIYVGSSVCRVREPHSYRSANRDRLMYNSFLRARRKATPYGLQSGYIGLIATVLLTLLSRCLWMRCLPPIG